MFKFFLLSVLLLSFENSNAQGLIFEDQLPMIQQIEKETSQLQVGKKQVYSEEAEKYVYADFDTLPAKKWISAHNRLARKFR